MISVLILRSVESEQTSRENQPLHASLWIRCGGYPYRTALCPRKDFSSDSPTKILCHLGISQQGQARVYWMPPESQCFPRHRPLSRPLSGWSHSRAPSPSPQGCRQLLWKQLHYLTGCLLVPISATLVLGICTIVIPLSIQVEEASVLSLSELKESSAKIVFQTLSKQFS